MHVISRLIARCAVAAFAACSIDAGDAGPATLGDNPIAEDCGVIGDEDRNGLADCADLACAAACQPGCGDGALEAGEACDDGDGVDGDGCDSNCTITACGNGIQSSTEACDDGNAMDGDGCDNNCTITGCGDCIQSSTEACDDGNATNGDGCDNNCTVTACGNGIMTTNEACDDGNLVIGDGCDNDCTASAFAYLKASNTDASDHFGYSIALSADGSTLAVGAYYEDSAATGINGNQDSDSAFNSGAVYVFTRSGAAWSQQAYVKASNAQTNDRFGYSVALSADGSTLVVGAYLEDSAATGIGGNQANNSATEAGAVYVFTRSGVTWSQQAYVKASNTSGGAEFGYSLALSADGSTLAVGAHLEDSAATGIDGNQGDNSATSAGAIYVFTRSGAIWSQQAYVKASNTDGGDEFGYSLALSADGSTLAVSADREDSAATGIGGNQADNSATDAGAVYVFTRSGVTWSQQAYVKASNTGGGDTFGYSLALSADSSTLAVGAFHEDSAATGIGGDQSSNAAGEAGAVYVFTRSGTTWSQQAYVKASNAQTSDQFGSSIAMSGDGSNLAVGAFFEDSAATGINGSQNNNSTMNAGAVYGFTRSGTTWSQQVYVKASNTQTSDQFGNSVALSADGSTLAVGAYIEDSAATGIDGDQSNNAAPNSGAVYVFY